MNRGMCGDEASKRGRDSDSERLRGLEINQQLELGGLLDRKVGRFLALEDSLSVGSSPTASQRNPGHTRSMRRPLPLVGKRISLPNRNSSRNQSMPQYEMAAVYSQRRDAAQSAADTEIAHRFDLEEWRKPIPISPTQVLQLSSYG
jgi:hypothetical protein